LWIHQRIFVHHLFLTVKGCRWVLNQLGASQHAPTYATERRKTKTSLDQRAKRRAKARSNVPPVQQDGMGPLKSGNIARKMFSTTAENVLAKLRADEERSEKFCPRWWRAVGPFKRRCLWPVVRNKKDLLVVDTDHPSSACPT
jgi:hypothetical protein